MSQAKHVELVYGGSFRMRGELNRKIFDERNITALIFGITSI